MSILYENCRKFARCITGFYAQNLMEEIAVADGSSHYKVENGALVKVDAAKGNALVYYPPRHAGDSFTVPDDVTNVGAYSLSYNPNLISVDLNKTLTTETNGVNELHNLTTLGIPANTGVLLKVLDQTSTPSDFYYTIGEHDDAAYSITNNLMHGVTINSTDIPASEAEPIYVMSKGEFHKVTSTGKNFPAHRAYLRLPAGTNAKANLVIGFADDNQATCINVVRPAAATDNHYYNLKGQEISRPVRGFYIHNGKKMFDRNEE